MSPLPVAKFKSLSAWGTVLKMYRNEFINFEAKTSEGLRQSAIAINDE
jgi:hypothetical protein